MSRHFSTRPLIRVKSQMKLKRGSKFWLRALLKYCTQMFLEVCLNETSWFTLSWLLRASSDRTKPLMRQSGTFCWEALRSLQLRSKTPSLNLQTRKSLRCLHGILYIVLNSAQQDNLTEFVTTLVRTGELGRTGWNKTFLIQLNFPVFIMSL